MLNWRIIIQGLRLIVLRRAYILRCETQGETGRGGENEEGRGGNDGDDKKQVFMEDNSERRWKCIYYICHEILEVLRFRSTS